MTCRQTVHQKKFLLKFYKISYKDRQNLSTATICNYEGTKSFLLKDQTFQNAKMTDISLSILPQGVSTKLWSLYIQQIFPNCIIHSQRITNKSKRITCQQQSEEGFIPNPESRANSIVKKDLSLTQEVMWRLAWLQDLQQQIYKPETLNGCIYKKEVACYLLQSSYHIVRRNPRTSIRKLCRFFLNFWKFGRSREEERLFELVRDCNAFANLDFSIGFACLSINSLPSLYMKQHPGVRYEKEIIERIMHNK